jgi:hypothetical protein
MHHLHESLDVHQNVVLAKLPYHYIVVIGEFNIKVKCMMAISLPNSSNIDEWDATLEARWQIRVRDTLSGDDLPA